MMAQPILAAEPAGCIRAGVQVRIAYTGYSRSCRTIREDLYGPTPREVVQAVLRALGRQAETVAFVHTPDKMADRGVLAMSCGQGEGRWPLAIITAENGMMTLADLGAALQDLHREAGE